MKNEQFYAKVRYFQFRLKSLWYFNNYNHYDTWSLRIVFRSSSADEFNVHYPSFCGVDFFAISYFVLSYFYDK